MAKTSQSPKGWMSLSFRVCEQYLTRASVTEARWKKLPWSLLVIIPNFFLPHYKFHLMRLLLSQNQKPLSWKIFLRIIFGRAGSLQYSESIAPEDLIKLEFKESWSRQSWWVLRDGELFQSQLSFSDGSSRLRYGEDQLSNTTFANKVLCSVICKLSGRPEGIIAVTYLES